MNKYSSQLNALDRTKKDYYVPVSASYESWGQNTLQLLFAIYEQNPDQATQGLVSMDWEVNGRRNSEGNALSIRGEDYTGQKGNKDIRNTQK